MLCLFVFLLAPFAGSEHAYLWAGAGILGVAFCGLGHAATCEWIDRSR
jgi:hypothetical protein